ncbi:hypothetical protein LINPERHAP2_LOCUS6476 [Linum perenne]
METKQNRNYMEKVRHKMRLTNSFYVEPEGSAGGLAVWWINEANVTILQATKNYIDLKIVMNGEMYVTCVYGAPECSDRDEVWQSILAFNRDTLTPWCLIGDFNAIRTPEEKEAARPPNPRSMREFNGFITDARITDIPFIGQNYTWSNNQEVGRTVRQRLDRAMCNIGWLDVYPDCYVTHLARTESDHCPIYLRTEGDTSRSRQRRFFFEKSWAEADGYKDCVERNWGIGATSNEKLRMMGKKLTEWKKETIGRQALIKGLRRNIGNGETTWLDDAWVPGLDEYKCHPDRMMNCRVCDCIDQGSRT